MFERTREIWREAVAMGMLRHELETLLPPARSHELLSRFRAISKSVECPHNESHVLSFVVALLKLPPGIEGCIVEAGCYKGGSTAKLSLVARYLGRPLVVFDSFEGLPPNSEDHDRTIHGTSVRGWFRPKAFCGSLEEVRKNVGTHGDLEVCRFVEGWFEDTMPGFQEKICAPYLDVDLAASTRTCLKHLYPRLAPGGFLMSQDGDFPLVIDVFRDDTFWREVVGCGRPPMEGLGKSKMVTVAKAPA